MKKINIIQTLQSSWTKTKENFWVITNVLLLTALIFFITNLFSTNVEETNIFLNTLAFAINAIVDAFMMFALIKFFLRISNGASASVFGMFLNTKGFYKFFILYTAINLATFAGVILLLIPAVYVFLTYAFATYIYLDKNLNIQESIIESARITKGNKLQILKFFLCLLVLNICGGAFFLIGLLVTLPLSFLSIIEVYKKLSNPVILPL